VRHTVIAVVRDRPGALNRAVSLFRRRNVNIHSITVGASESPGLSRMTLVVDAAAVDQLIKQLRRLLDVLEVTDVTATAPLEREIVLVRVGVTPGTRPEIVALCTAVGGRVLDVATGSMVLELTGAPADLEHFIELMRPFGLQELARTGLIAMVRSPRSRTTATVLQRSPHSAASAFATSTTTT
jgi:acetolactate synthase-1/3 small subunit